MRRSSISIFGFQYMKKVAAMGICDYNERKKKKTQRVKPVGPRSSLEVARLFH
jgi:hypothetical protein